MLEEIASRGWGNSSESNAEMVGIALKFLLSACAHKFGFCLVSPH